MFLFLFFFAARQENNYKSCVRVKSLSKGNSSKREPLSSINLRNSIAVTSSMVSASGSDENVPDVPKHPETNKFGWSKQAEKESSPSPLQVERVPSGRMQSSQVQQIEDVFDYSGIHEQDKSWLTNLESKIQIPKKYGDLQSDVEEDDPDDDDLTALLKVTS